MKLPLTVLVLLLTVCRSLCEDINASGTEREDLVIMCPYPAGYETSYKYVYKGPYRDRNVILKSYGGESTVSSGRFSLRDDHETRRFMVTIRQLRMDDAGLYGCVAGWGDYRLIHLTVNRAPRRTRPVQISTSTESSTSVRSHPSLFTMTHRTENDRRATTGSSTDALSQPTSSLVSVAGGLGLALLVLILRSGTFFILMKRTAAVQLDGADTDVTYEEIPNVLLSNQTPSSHLRARPKVSTVYATVANQQLDSNPDHTHSTNQVTPTDCDYYAEIAWDSDLRYSSTSEKTSANDGPVYSEIKQTFI